MNNPNQLVTSVGGATIYGASALPRFFGDEESCCRLHEKEDIGDVSCGQFGSPSGKVAGIVGVGGCLAGQEVVAKDKRLARIAYTMSIPGFSWSSPGGLAQVRRFRTSAIYSTSIFGTGYCYLKLMLPDLRYRCARILGPNPLLSDVMALFRLCGMEKIHAEVSGGYEGVFHLHDTKDHRSGRHMAKSMLGILQLCPGARLGASSTDPVSGLFGPLVDVPDGFVDSGRQEVEKVHCEICGFFVNPVNHVFRCRASTLKRSARKELLGDAVHMLDVKVLVTNTEVAEKMYTIVASRYASKTGQAAYMRAIGIDLGHKRSEKDLSNEFERDYIDKHRGPYLKYLSAGLGIPLSCLDEFYSCFSGVLDPTGNSKRQVVGSPVVKFRDKFEFYGFLVVMWLSVLGMLSLIGFMTVKVIGWPTYDKVYVG